MRACAILALLLVASPLLAGDPDFEVLVLGTYHAPVMFRGDTYTPAHIRAASGPAAVTTTWSKSVSPRGVVTRTPSAVRSIRWTGHPASIVTPSPVRSPSRRSRMRA